MKIDALTQFKYPHIGIERLGPRRRESGLEMAGATANDERFIDMMIERVGGTFIDGMRVERQCIAGAGPHKRLGHRL